MSYTGSSNRASSDHDSLRSEPRDSGYKRKKLAGFLKAANEVRQSYWSGDGSALREDGEGSYGDAAMVRSGNEEMILFPSYARRHVKSKVRTHAGGAPPMSG